MTLTVTIDNDSREIDALVRKSPVRLAQVSRKIANHIASDLYKDLSSIIPKEAGTNVSGFKRVRAHKSRTLVRRKRNHAKVWLGGNRIAARYGGRLRNTKGGAFAGKHFFAGSYVATMKSGYRSIFHRTIGGRLVQDYIEVPDMHPIATRQIRLKHAGWELRLKQEVEAALSR